MAAFSSNKLHDLIDRFLGSPQLRFASGSPAWRKAPIAEYDVPSARPQCSDDIDALWLRRVEIRSIRDVATLLGATAFQAKSGTMAALFVDKRCGLISAVTSLFSAAVKPEEAAREILRHASWHHAHGIILATHDPSGSIGRRRDFREMTSKLLQKGEVIDVILLDNLVLTDGGWVSLLPRSSRSLPTCAS